MGLAMDHHRAGRFPEAETHYRKVLAEFPAHSGALHLLGILAAQVGNPHAAVQLIRRAIATNPTDANAFSDLGNALQACGQIHEALEAYRHSLSLKPDSTQALNNLGNALRVVEKTEEAISAYGEALRIDPNYADAWNNLGNALVTCGKFDEAIAAYTEAIQLNPESADFRNNFGMASRWAGKIDEAADAYREALRLRPAFAEASQNLASCYKALGQIDDAIERYRQAVALDPASGVMHSNLVYALYFHPDYDARAILAENQEWDRRHGQPLASRIAAHVNDRSPERRLRIGYVSPDFREHVVGRNLLPLIREHDRDKFEIFCYANVLKADALTEQLRAMAKGWRDIVGVSDEAAAEMIRGDEIDILVDLTLHMAHNRLPLFACKPAPVQVTYLGYCGTTGLAAMDYRLSDPYLDPPGGEPDCYSEKTVRLPRSYWCYEPLGPTPDVSALPAHRLGYVTFGCLNNFAKVSAGTLESWMTILREVPDSRLLLQAPAGRTRQRVIERFAKSGLKKERLEFVGMREWEGYIECLSRLDVALDPFPYGGGITSCDALWMGVPVLTLNGATAVGRGGRSILSNIGLPELVAETAENYVDKAVALAGDLPRLSELRSTLRARMECSPLRDAKRHARDIEAAFREMWRQCCVKREAS